MWTGDTDTCSQSVRQSVRRAGRQAGRQTEMEALTVVIKTIPITHSQCEEDNSRIAHVIGALGGVMGRGTVTHICLLENLVHSLTPPHRHWLFAAVAQQLRVPGSTVQYRGGGRSGAEGMTGQRTGRQAGM